MKQILFILFTLVCSPFMKAQTSVDYVESQYPGVFADIYSGAISQFKNNAFLQERNIEEQVSAFLELAENAKNIDDAAMTDALIRWSNKGEEAHNRSVINDLSIDNPFPYLRCDWTFAKIQYERTKSGLHAVQQQKAATLAVASTPALSVLPEENFRQLKATQHVHAHECESCTQKAKQEPTYFRSNSIPATKLVPAMVKERDNVETRCTAKGNCVACKSENKSRDFCSHLTPQYINLLNKRHGELAPRIERQEKRTVVRYSRIREATRPEGLTTIEEIIEENTEPQIYTPSKSSRFQKKRVEVIPAPTKSERRQTTRTRKFDNKQF